MFSVKSGTNPSLKLENKSLKKLKMRWIGYMPKFRKATKKINFLKSGRKNRTNSCINALNSAPISQNTSKEILFI